MPPTPREPGAGPAPGPREGRVRTAEDDDAVSVLPTGSTLDGTGEPTCDRRDGDLW